MQTLQSLTSFAMVTSIAILMGGGQARGVDLAAAMSCLDTHDRFARLTCYDEAMGYVPDTLAPAQQDVSPILPQKTRYGRFLDSLFDQQAPTARLRMTVIDPATSLTVAIAEEGSDAFADLMKIDPKEYDIYLTMLGRETGANAGKAGLVLACEQKITQIIVLWNGVLRVGAAPARLYTDDRSSDPLRTTMRGVENGYATRAPRGLEAIALLKVLRARSRLQVSVDQEAAKTRSALFDIDGLDRNLRLLSRRCGWS